MHSTNRNIKEYKCFIRIFFSVICHLGKSITRTVYAAQRTHWEWVHALFWFPRFTHTHTHTKSTDLQHTTAMCFSFSLSVRWNYLLVTTHSELGKLKATQCRSNKCHQNGIVSYIFFCVKRKMLHTWKRLCSETLDWIGIQIPEFAMTNIFMLVTSEFLYCICFSLICYKIAIFWTLFLTEEKKMCLWTKIAS